MARPLYGYLLIQLSYLTLLWERNRVRKGMIAPSITMHIVQAAQTLYALFGTNCYKLRRNRGLPACILHQQARCLCQSLQCFGAIFWSVI
jgi:hypothetical protein